MDKPNTLKRFEWPLQPRRPKLSDILGGDVVRSLVEQEEAHMEEARLSLSSENVPYSITADECSLETHM